jgi:hypothetical protein
MGISAAADIGTGGAFRGRYYRQFGSGIYNSSTGTYVGLDAAADIMTGGTFWSWKGGLHEVTDIAEYIFMRKEDEIKPGDVVVIDDKIDGQLKLSSKAYDTTVAGIVSSKDTAALIAGNSEGGKKLLALAGQVKVKASTINGPIKRGDLLVTSSKPGYAMKADPNKLRPGMILGKALEPLEEGEGKIMVLVAMQ